MRILFKGAYVSVLRWATARKVKEEVFVNTNSRTSDGGHCTPEATRSPPPTLLPSTPRSWTAWNRAWELHGDSFPEAVALLCFFCISASCLKVPFYHLMLNFLKRKKETRILVSEINRSGSFSLS